MTLLENALPAFIFTPVYVHYSIKAICCFSAPDKTKMNECFSYLHHIGLKCVCLFVCFRVFL